MSLTSSIFSACQSGQPRGFPFGMVSYPDGGTSHQPKTYWQPPSDPAHPLTSMELTGVDVNGCRGVLICDGNVSCPFLSSLADISIPLFSQKYTSNAGPGSGPIHLAWYTQTAPPPAPYMQSTGCDTLLALLSIVPVLGPQIIIPVHAPAVCYPSTASPAALLIPSRSYAYRGSRSQTEQYSTVLAILHHSLPG